MDRAPDDEARQRRLEQALQGSEERFRRLVEAAKDYAIFTADVDGRVSTWNEGGSTRLRLRRRGDPRRGWGHPLHARGP